MMILSMTYRLSHWSNHTRWSRVTMLSLFK